MSSSILLFATERISSRREFSEFVDKLATDLALHGHAWENPTLESFLEALSAYVRDIDGYYANAGIDIDPDAPSWRVFADVLLGARLYE